MSLLPALSTALGELERAYSHERDQLVGMPTIDEWANLLRVFDDTPIDSLRLPGMVRLSKRAVRSRVLAALRKGWIKEAKLGRGVITLSLTERGHKVANSWNILSVLGLPMLALLSQALVAFAMSYEEMSPVALTLSSTVIRCIPPDGRSRKGLGDSAGISALVRHGFLHSEVKAGDEFIRLTSRGVSVQESYDQRISAVEAEWRTLFGDDAFVEFELAVKTVAEKQRD